MIGRVVLDDLMEKVTYDQRIEDGDQINDAEHLVEINSRKKK